MQFVELAGGCEKINAQGTFLPIPALRGAGLETHPKQEKPQTNPALPYFNLVKLIDDHFPIRELGNDFKVTPHGR